MTDLAADPALAAIVLAAGEGTRMRSTRPKPLHLLCGRAMLLHVLDALGTSQVRRVVVVVGHGAERVTNLGLAFTSFDFPALSARGSEVGFAAASPALISASRPSTVSSSLRPLADWSVSSSNDRPMTAAVCRS